MSDAAEPGPALGVSVRVDRRVAGTRGSEDAQEMIAAGIAGVMDDLGLPGRPEVDVGPADADHGDARVELGIGGRTLVFPLALRSAVGRLHGDPAGWSEALVGGESAEAVSLAAVEAVRARPGLLLGPGQVTAYRPTLGLDPMPGVTSGDAWLRSVIAPVVSIGVSISETHRCREVVSAGWARGRRVEDIAEDLIESLAPELIEIHLPASDLRAFSLDAGTQDRAAFQGVRDSMRYLGVRSPPFSFVADEHLSGATFAFRVHHVMGAPWHGLAPDELLATLSPAAATVKRSLIKPHDWSSGSVVDRAARDELDEVGLPVSTPVEYMADCLQHEMRQRGAWFVSRSVVAAQLEETSLLFPQLVRAVRRRYSDEQITRVLRAILSEDGTVWDIERILERLLAFEWTHVRSVRSVIVDDVLPVLHRAAPAADPDALAAFVRGGLVPSLVERLGPSPSPILAHALDPDLEEEIGLRLERDETDRDEDNEAFGMSVREAILKRALAGTIPTGLPLVVSTFDVKAFLRELVPLGSFRLPIATRMELARSRDVQPVGVVTLGDGP